MQVNYLLTEMSLLADQKFTTKSISASVAVSSHSSIPIVIGAGPFLRFFLYNYVLLPLCNFIKDIGFSLWRQVGIQARHYSSSTYGGNIVRQKANVIYQLFWCSLLTLYCFIISPSIQLGLYLTKNDNHTVREMRINGGCKAISKTAFTISQVIKSDMGDIPMVNIHVTNVKADNKTASP
jgi:hypothetical protein